MTGRGSVTFGRMGRGLLDWFWDWYERHYVLNVAVALGLFVLQLAHLGWLSADVVAERLTGSSYWSLDGLLALLVQVVDYAEIPALLSVSLVYLHELRNGLRVRPLLLLVLLNSQWLHLFWITDEFVLQALSDEPRAGMLPGWLAWVAILIDYLELPVMWATAQRLATAIRRRQRIPVGARG
jgi:hypothetical protein